MQHGCSSVTLNGRPGVVVSGGVDSNNFNTTSVEFFDMNTHRWINLPSLSRSMSDCPLSKNSFRDFGHTLIVTDEKLDRVGPVVNRPSPN